MAGGIGACTVFVGLRPRKTPRTLGLSFAFAGFTRAHALPIAHAAEEGGFLIVQGDEAALLDNAPPRKHIDVIAIAHGRKPVSNDEDCEFTM